MRVVPILLVCATVGVTACSSPTDVIVTESGESSSSTNGTTPVVVVTDPVGTTTSIPSTTENSVASGLADHLLVQDDLPAWNVVRPTDVPGEDTWTAVDCDPMNVAWAATGRPGVRARGTLDSTSFRQTAVEFTSVDEAAAVVEAVDRVWVECNPLNSTLGEFWAEPWEMPASRYPASALLLGGQTADMWALAFWQVDNAIVVLEVNGDDLWYDLDTLLATAAARLEGTPIDPIEPAPTTTEVLEYPATTVPQRPVDTTPGTPPPTLPPIVPTTPMEEPREFPPTDEDWAEHPLVRLAPHPDALGDDWRYQFGSLNDAAPADPDDAIPGCDAPVPPTLDGFEVDYRRGGSGATRDLEIVVGQGTPEDAQVLVTAVRAIAGCDLAEGGVDGNYTLSNTTIPSADDAAVISSRFSDSADFEVSASIAVARVDGIHIGVFVGAESPATPADVEAEVVATITEMIAAI